MIGAHQHLNGSRDLTTPLSNLIGHPWATLATINLLTWFEVSITADQKVWKGIQNVENGVAEQLGVIQGHRK